MRTGFLASAILILLLAPAAARAQETAFGYAFASPTVIGGYGPQTFAWHVGGGGERWVGNRTTIGGEFGYLDVPQDGYGLIVSANGSRHFPGSDKVLGPKPFVTGGVSLFVSGGIVGLFNVGDGVDWWLRPHAGLRFEVRDQFLAAPVLTRFGMLGFRIGIVFR